MAALVAAALPLLAPAVAAQEDETHLAPVIAALRCLALTPRDVAIHYDHVADMPQVDHYRLKLVDRLMAEPLSAEAVTTDLSSRLATAETSLALIAPILGELVDVTMVEPAAPPELDPDRPLAAVLENLWGPAGPGAPEGRPERFAKLPLPLRRAITILLNGMNTAARRLKRAYGDLSSREYELLATQTPRLVRQGRELDIPLARQTLTAAAKVRVREIMAANAALSVAVDGARAELAQLTARGNPFLGSGRARAEILLNLETPLGRVRVCGTGNDVHTTPAAVLIDLGGRDAYRPEPVASTLPLKVIIDLAGDDEYFARHDYAQGCGVFGISVLVDERGDDLYQGSSFCQGAGFFGAGTLLDVAGRDRYFGDTGTQAAGLVGTGLLLDVSGDDLYSGALLSQAAGWFGGAGVLLDRDGNDTYLLGGAYRDTLRDPREFLCLGQGFGFGVRPLASGGIGLLLDLNGHDRYVGDCFTQGSAYWYGFGALFDRQGNDEYLSHRYAQGAGCDLSVGLLLDGGGNDGYRTWASGQGAGHDLAIGLLIDCDGDDAYQAQTRSQGAGYRNGIGLLWDRAGDDAYQARSESTGWGAHSRGFGSIGLFVDAAGKDQYGGHGRNQGVWTDGAWGAGVDLEPDDLDDEFARAVRP